MPHGPSVFIVSTIHLSAPSLASFPLRAVCRCCLLYTSIEQHGVRFTNNPDTLKRSMEECNIAYLHAQLFNPAMKFVGPVRKTLGVRTLFNLLGPLVNPCCPAYQLLGVDVYKRQVYIRMFSLLSLTKTPTRLAQAGRYPGIWHRQRGDLG